MSLPHFTNINDTSTNKITSCQKCYDALELRRRKKQMPTLQCIHVYDFRKYVCLLSTIAEDTLALDSVCSVQYLLHCSGHTSAAGGVPTSSLTDDVSQVDDCSSSSWSRSGVLFSYKKHLC